MIRVHVLLLAAMLYTVVVSAVFIVLQVLLYTYTEWN